MSFRFRRPSPAMIVATLALGLSTAGTAAAAVLISSPDQIADRVITNPKLATSAVDGRALAFNTVNTSHLRDGQVGSNDLASPVFSASVNEDGTTTTARSVGVNVSRTRKAALGYYQVVFQRDIANCSIAATASERGVTANALPSSSDARNVDVHLTKPFLSFNTFVVPVGVDGPFSVVVQC